jgi:hypothetical protein
MRDPEEIIRAAEEVAGILESRGVGAVVNVLVSWNFKHIVNLRRIHAFNAVNLKQGYPVLEIRNPREVIGEE